MTPVVTVRDAALVPAVRAAAALAAAGGAIAVVDAPPNGAIAEGAEIVVVACGRPGVERDLLADVLERHGRAIPVLGLASDPAGMPSLTAETIDLLGDPSLRDLHVAVPAFEDDRMRTRLWDQLRGREVEARHQLAEVSAGSWSSLPAVGTDPWAAAGAFAAGILAGRIAAGNRRWRAQLSR